MKTAIMHIAMLEFSCPDCDEFFTSNAVGASASMLFSMQEEMPKTVHCDCCDKEYKIPEKAFNMKAGTK